VGHEGRIGPVLRSAALPNGVLAYYDQFVARSATRAPKVEQLSVGFDLGPVIPIPEPPSDTMKQIVSIRMPDALIERVDAVAKSRGVSPSSLMRALIAAGLADSVMTAHVFNRGLDPWDPATLSRFTVQRVLRGWLHYDGVAVSDDLLMGAIAQHYGLEDAAVLALGAGVDVLLIGQNTDKQDDRAAERVVAAITRAIAAGTLRESRIREAVTRVDALRAKLK